MSVRQYQAVHLQIGSWTSPCLTVAALQRSSGKVIYRQFFWRAASTERDYVLGNSQTFTSRVFSDRNQSVNRSHIPKFTIGHIRLCGNKPRYSNRFCTTICGIDSRNIFNPGEPKMWSFRLNKNAIRSVQIVHQLLIRKEKTGQINFKFSDSSPKMSSPKKLRKHWSQKGMQ
jgi:hypothetical protein